MSHTKEYTNEYYKENRAKLSARSKDWQNKNYLSMRDNKIRNARKWALANPDKKRAICSKSQRTLRLEVLSVYGGSPPECKCCGERMLQFLALDHIFGGGNKHRKDVGNVYSWVKKNNYPDGYQVLCHNCNQAKSWYGECPHKLCQ